MCTVCGHSHVYYSCVLLYYIHCLWLLPRLLFMCTTLVSVLLVATPTSTIVCPTLVCVLFVATPTSTIDVYYFSMCTLCGHSQTYYSCVLLSYVYYLWPLPCLLFVCTTLVCVLFVATTIRVSNNSVSVYSVYYSYYFSEKCTPTSQLPIHVSYNSVSVYYFYYYILKLYLPPPTGEESPWTTASHWRQKQTNIFFSSFHIY